jgi:class 3 adenylate cyclase
LIFYEFLHDQVQQAAYSLIPEAAKKEVHLKIGRLIFKSTPPKMLAENVFDIVNQLNFGAALITEPDEREQLTHLNLMAGKKAKASTAYEPARRYLAAGMEMLAADSWCSQYDLTFALYRERAEAEYLVHNFEQSAALFELLLENAQTSLEKANIYNLRAVQYANLGQFDQVLQAGLTALNLLGVNLSDTEEATQLAVGAELAAIQANQGERQIADLRHLPLMSNPVKQTTIRLFNTMLAPTYLLGKMSLTFLLAAKMVNMSITHGNADVSAPGYIWYGLFVGAGLGNLKEGYEFGLLALSLEESPARHQVTYLFASSVNHFRQPGRIGVDFYQRAYQMCVEAGDLVYAGYASNCIPITMLMAGWQLDEVDETIQRYQNTVKVTKNPYAHLWPIYQQTVRNLKGLTPQRISLSEGDFDEAECLAQLTKLANEGADIISLNWLGMLKTMQLYIFEEYEDALKYATIVNNTIAASTGLYLTPCYNFYYALLLTALYPTAPAEEQQTYWEKLEQYQAGLQNWVENSPANFEHQHLLVAAEMARLSGQTLAAMELYDRAIASARDNEYPQNEAIANELAAKFYRTTGKEKIAQVYLWEARYAYLKWGAGGKVAALDEKYPQLLAQAGVSSAMISRTIPTASDTMPSSALDLISVLKASQAISGEIELDKLLTNLMKIVIENAGAQRGYLILEKEGRWQIEAEGRLAEAETEVMALESVPVEQSKKLPLAVINYVARTRENVVLNEATREGLFTQDPYIIQSQPKSILCAPLINQGKLNGILYLENALTSGAFTPDRLEVLNLLSAQAAISIENARLYTHQVELTNSASRFVPQEFLQFLRKDSMVKLNLGDQVQQNMTILVSDIRSFTTLSETMTPQENFDFVNAYLGRVSPIIRQHNGLIAKYMGDGMMAVFPRQVEDALNAAIAQLKEVARYNADRQQRGEAPLQIGIGVHTGPVMLGTVGDTQRMQLDLFSDAVNVAARLEGLSKLYGVPLIMSTEALQRLAEPDQYQVRFLGKTPVKGRQEMLSVFEVFDGDSADLIALKSETRADFEKGLSLYFGWHFAEAKTYFEQVLQRYPADKATQFYLQRMADFTENKSPAGKNDAVALIEP